ncbi:MAG: pentapeptide repeat-containing protein [Alphaproteobacteria bacterium]
MEKITQEQLLEIIERHKKFLMGSGGGQRAILTCKDLSGLDFRLADLSNADFSGARLDGANMSQASFVNASFFSCDMHKTDMKNSNFTRADFRGAEVIGSDLSEADFTHADFRQGHLLNYKSENPDEGWGKHGHTRFSGSTVRDTNLSGVMAQHANFSETNLSGVIIQNANLSGVDLTGANLSDTDFTGCSMARAKFEKAIVDGTNLSGVIGDISALKDMQAEQKQRKRFDDRSAKKNIALMVKNHSLWVASDGGNGQQLNLSGYDLSHETHIKKYPLSIIIAEDCKFAGLDLEGVSMQSSTLDKSDFRDCAAYGADFRGSSFKDALFTRADLSHADFSALKVEKKGKSAEYRPANLTGARFAYANLENTNFKGADLSGADFTRADLRGADLTDAILTGVVFEGADLTDTKMPEMDIIESKSD